VLSEEGGEGGGGDVLGGEAEDVSDLIARIELNWGCSAYWMAVLPCLFLVVRESELLWIIRRARNTSESQYSWLLQATCRRS